MYCKYVGITLFRSFPLLSTFLSLTRTTLQIEALKEAGRAIGDGLVTLAVNTTGAVGQKGAQHSVEAFQVGWLLLDLIRGEEQDSAASSMPFSPCYPTHGRVYLSLLQVSQQAVQMLWDGLIDESKAGPTQAVPTTRYVTPVCPYVWDVC